MAELSSSLGLDTLKALLLEYSVQGKCHQKWRAPVLPWVSEEDTRVSVFKIRELALRCPPSHKVSEASKQKPQDLKLSHLLVCLPHESSHWPYLVFMLGQRSS